jgi:hypothetical protein
LIALKGLLSTVHSEMPLQVALFGGAEPALIALKRLLSSVQPQVSRQVALAGRAKPTLLALVHHHCIHLQSAKRNHVRKEPESWSVRFLIAVPLECIPHKGAACEARLHRLPNPTIEVKQFEVGVKNQLQSCFSLRAIVGISTGPHLTSLVTMARSGHSATPRRCAQLLGHSRTVRERPHLLQPFRKKNQRGTRDF